MLNMYASTVVLPDALNSAFMVTVTPFVGFRYIVRCPGCAVVSMCPYDDGNELRQCPLWKTCELGHKFLVSLDDTAAFDRVAFVDNSEHPHPMQSSTKKARVGPSRAEQMWDEQKVRERMGLAAPLYQCKPRPAPLQVPRMSIVDPSPQLHCALTRLLAVEPDAPKSAPRADARQKRRAPHAYDSDDEEVDIDAALQTKHDMEVETEMLDTDSE